jgi:hypothetical protein
MKLKALFAAAAMAASSASFALIDNGDNYATLTGGEMILVAWDDVAQKSIVFDTGVNFKQIVDNKDALAPTIINLAAIDSTYKSFFNNNFSNVYWNAYVGSKWSNGELFDSNKYFGYGFTAKDPAFELANPRDFGTAVAQIEAASFRIDFQHSFGGNNDPTDVSVNRSYRANSGSDPHYMGDLTTFWGNQMGGNYPLGTSAKAGEFLTLVYNTANFDTAEGTVLALGRIVFDPTTDSLRINTPLPAAAWLLMSGIAGFGAIARRRKQQA